MSWTTPPLGPPAGPADASPIWDEVSVVFGEALHFGRDGKPITLRQWVTGLNTPEYRCLGRTLVGDIEVITAWTGIDFNDDGCIFGTVELCAEVYRNEVMTRTEQEARDEHDRRVTVLRELCSLYGRSSLR